MPQSYITGKLEAAGIEPASNKDLIKASTDVVCFVFAPRIKNKQKTRGSSFLSFHPQGTKGKSLGTYPAK